MAALLILGVMDLRVMLVVAVAITVERVAPQPVVWARVTGVVILAMGAVAILNS
jgi:predicted metal-binding membrane protein